MSFHPDWRCAREWYRALTPIEQARADTMAELRREWSVADGVVYGVPRGIPSSDSRRFQVMLPLPRIPVDELVAMDLRVETRVVETQLYRLIDGRDLFIVGRCPETATVYFDNVSPPIDYDRMGPDVVWMHGLWHSFGRLHVPGIADGIRALCSP